MSFQYTDEQIVIIDNAKTGQSGVCQAGAGTGKTSTFKGVAKAMPDTKFLYLAYNKAIQLEAAASFPQNVRCKTAHSLAFGAVGRDYKHRLNGPRVTARQVAGMLGIREDFIVGPDMSLKPWQLARLVLDMVKRYCYSADETINRRHLPWLAGTEKVRDELALFCLPFAEAAWADLCSLDGKLRFEHDHYLKIWALTHPTLKVDSVLFDEAQDANGVIDGVVREQDCQKIYVGDSAQAIYGWRGAVDAMASFDADWVCTLSQSFRFGPAVADEANKWLDVLDAPLRLKGFNAIDSQVVRCDDPDTILARTNATVVAEALAAQQAGKKVAIVGGTSEIKRFAEAARDLQTGRGTAHADLTAFQNWGQVQEYVNSDEGGADLKVFVKLIDTYGVAVVERVADEAVNEDVADLIVSTAHKSKGREWHKVRIADDFNEPAEDKQIAPAEAMLAYVAVTRAQYVLDRTGLEWIDNFQIGPSA